MTPRWWFVQLPRDLPNDCASLLSNIHTHFVLFFCLYTLLSLSGYSGCLSWVRLQQLQEQRYPVLQLASPWYDHRGWLGVKNNYLSILHVHAGSFRVSVIHQTLHMDYRIFNVRMCSFLCVRIHTEVGHTDHESAQHFLTRKNSHKFVLCSWWGSNFGS